MLNLTKEQAILNHRNMWNWIAEQNEKGIHEPHLKSEYINEHTEFISKDMSCSCFCCEYDEIQDNIKQAPACAYCPLDWDSKANDLFCIRKTKEYENKNGYFYLWEHETDPKEAAKLARIIANLPERRI